MPGFNICGSGNGPSAAIELRRKHRWHFETLGRGSGQFSQQELLILMTAQRPSFKFDEPDMHHDQEVARFAGKQDWETVSLTWYDAEQDPDVSNGIYQWLESVVNFATANVNPPSVYKRQGTLNMHNGQGIATESWLMCNTWPKEVNWGELDYSATEICTIEAVMRFDRALKTR